MTFLVLKMISNQANSLSECHWYETIYLYFQALLEHDLFHRCLLACCLEIIIFSYNSQRYKTHTHVTLYVLQLSKVQHSHSCHIIHVMLGFILFFLLVMSPPPPLGGTYCFCLVRLSPFFSPQ